MRKLIFALFLFILFPLSASAASSTPFEVGGWIPYWRAAQGTADVLPKLSGLTEVSPFVFSVKADGTLAESSDLTAEPWTSFIAAAKRAHVRVVPAITWQDGDAIDTILTDTASRIALENEIANLVWRRGYDGIDIDFEAKSADTRPYFSTFLKGLYMRMGPKWVYCSIEARTPLADRFDAVPQEVEYANDYAAINSYCDRVEVMAYDQGEVDLSLDRARAAPYVPVSDPAWAEKVLDVAAQSIPKRKLILGVATYGYEYSATPTSSGFSYTRQWAFNPQYALGLAAKLGITPVRNSAGELSFFYHPDTAAAPSGAATVPATNNPNVIGPAAAFSQEHIAPAPLNLVWWSDAQAVADKVAVAERLGIRGVAVFKFDGGEDPNIWNILPPTVH